MLFVLEIEEILFTIFHGPKIIQIGYPSNIRAVQMGYASMRPLISLHVGDLLDPIETGEL